MMPNPMPLRMMPNQQIPQNMAITQQQQIAINIINNNYNIFFWMVNISKLWVTLGSSFRTSKIIMLQDYKILVQKTLRWSEPFQMIIIMLYKMIDS